MIADRVDVPVVEVDGRIGEFPRLLGELPELAFSKFLDQSAGFGDGYAREGSLEAVVERIVRERDLVNRTVITLDELPALLDAWAKT